MVRGELIDSREGWRVIQGLPFFFNVGLVTETGHGVRVRAGAWESQALCVRRRDGRVSELDRGRPRGCMVQWA